MRRTWNQTGLSFKNCHTGSFSTHECSRDVESVLRKQLIEVVAGDASWNVRELCANQRGIAVAKATKGAVDLAAAAAAGNDGFEFLFRCRTDRQRGSVVEQNLELLNVIDS